MNVYRNIEDFEPIKNAVVTSGTFDGVHLGHLSIIKKLQEIAQESGGESTVITFFPHPRTVLGTADGLLLLSTLEEKIALLAQYGIQHLVIIPFTKAFSEQSSETFIQDILVKRISTNKLVIGYDHRFGKNREGGFDYLQANSERYGFEVVEIPKQEIEHIAISSTKIRTALLEGDIRTANDLLGRAYSFSGTVTRGQQLGRTIGYPTANIFVEDITKLIPANGVYAVQVILAEQTYKGMMNIGVRPTVGGLSRTIEVHIFDFDADIYDKQLSIEVFERTRSEKKFEGLDALKKQLAQDKQTIEAYFTSLPA